MASQNDEENDKKKRQATIEAIEFGYKLVLKEFSLTNDDVKYDINIISSVVDRYWKDVERLHHFHGIKHIDCHKISGYLTYWICKLKPFKIAQHLSYNKNKVVCIINEIISFYVSCARINSTRIKNKKSGIVIKNEFLQPFLYSLTFRPINGDWLSISYYLIDISF